MKYRIPKGTMDLLSPRIEYYQSVYQKALELFTQYGFSEVVTPVFEHTELFTRSIGESSDIVHKEMYTFQDRSGRSLTLRPEATAGVVRAYLEDKKTSIDPHQRWFYFGPMFRYERPQKGRYRQFYQLGMEIFGCDNPFYDAELIQMLVKYIESFQIDNYSIRVNNIGCRECRPVYNKNLQEYLTGHASHLCEDCKYRLAHNPLRVFDCKNKACQKIWKEGPRIDEAACSSCREHYQGFLHWLDQLEISYRKDPYLVRGFDYYTRVVFEFSSDRLGAQDAFVGGGRYDNLVSEFGGKPTPALGASFGVERLILLMQEHEYCSETNKPVYYFVLFDEENCRSNLELIQWLRKTGYSVLTGDYKRSLKQQFKEADKKGVDFVLIRGESELSGGTVQIKDFQKSEQSSIPVEEFKNHLGGKHT